MQWLRSNIRLGARLALFAIAVQFALSFGHVHALVAQAAPSIQSAQQQLPQQNPDPDQHRDDFCAICAVVGMASMAMAATPPALPVPQAFELAQLTPEATFEHPRFARAAFQSRAPPLS
jgi:Protein of unknown function (DUF2946)